MKVRQLIADTIWTPGRAYGRSEPSISLLCPTFRRGGDGLFLRAAHSVLAQTHCNLELIIVDDASTDGTADQIRDLMQHDDRVSLLTHPKNVGLPAISVFEGYLAARAPYVGFAFDDFVFESTAIGQLLAAATATNAAMLHGWARLATDYEGAGIDLGLDYVSYDMLNQTNFIPNAAVILRKDIVNRVGWLDPHICMARLCDWDYWKRIWQAYNIQRTKIFVGTEYGAVRTDSLGTTYPLDGEAVFEFARQDRNHLLTPEKYLDRDVWALPAHGSDQLKNFIRTSRSLLSAKEWAKPLSDKPERVRETTPEDNKRIFAVGHVGEATFSLMFDGLAGPLKKNVAYYQPCGILEADMRHLAGATAVILLRNIFDESYHSIAQMCMDLQIPVYYLMDDNFFALAHKEPAYRIFAGPKGVRRVQNYNGLILTSDALVKYAADRNLNQNIFAGRPLLNKQLELKDNSHGNRPLTVAFTGGPFRMDQLRKYVVPALHSLSHEFPVKLVVRGTAESIQGLAPHCFETVPGEFFFSFNEFIHHWQQYRPTVLVHTRAETPNADYKTANAILVAYLLGAVPVVADELAYAEVGEKDGVLKVGSDDVQTWRTALNRLNNPVFWSEMRGRLKTFCREYFNSSYNEEMLHAILARHPACDANAKVQRLNTLAYFIGRGARWRKVKRQVREGIRDHAPAPVLTVLRKARQLTRENPFTRRAA